MNDMRAAPRFSGVYPILYAFFDETGAIDADAMRVQTERCIAAGAHGIAVLGNVTEANKLGRDERLNLVEIVAGQIAGRVPYAVTVGDPNIEGQKSFIREVAKAGADWVILQPPPIKGVPEREIVRFFGAVADTCDLPVAVQNNPVNMDVWLSNDSLATLHRNHPNVTMLKAEGPAIGVKALIDATKGGLTMFSGQGGIEYMTNLRSGCAGLIPAPDCLAQQIRIFELWRKGTPEARAEAERLHRETLPLIVFMTRNLTTHQLPLGKRWVARHLGLTVHDRVPSAAPSAFGLEELERLVPGLDPFAMSASVSAAS
jgi:4-hydroxy-tetrahydrodipicolinate synthase